MRHSHLRIAAPAPESSATAFRIELWDQAERDLTGLSERDRVQFELRLARLANAASVRRRRFADVVDEEEQFARISFGAYDVGLKFDWVRGAVEVTSIAPPDDD